MPKYSRLYVLNTMIETGLVAIFYNRDVEVATHIVRACLEGGARCVELTNRGDQAHVVFGELVRRFENDDRAILGVGSVIDPGTAELYIQLGANYVVSPILNPEMAKVCNRRKIAFLPGCGSASEISQAEELGVEICKIFPGSQVGGPAFVKALLGPMAGTRIMPTGGVAPTEESIRAWFEAGAACVGMGSKLITKESVANRDYGAITENVRQVLHWIRDVRDPRFNI